MTTSSTSGATVNITAPGQAVELCVTNDVVLWGLYGSANGANPMARAQMYFPIAANGNNYNSLVYTSPKARYTLTPTGLVPGDFTKVPGYAIKLENLSGSGSDTITLWYSRACSHSEGECPYLLGLPKDTFDVTDTPFTITVNLPGAGAADPTVDTVSPGTGLASGGEIVAIRGKGFTDASAVTFGTIPATTFTVENDGYISTTVPQGAAGQVDVTVVTPHGKGTGIGLFTYRDGLSVTDVSPNRGPTSGNSVVVITGTNFSGVAAVSFGDVAAPRFTVDGPAQITAVTPPHLVGSVDVTVTATSGKVTAANLYSYAAALAPTVTDISPASGPVAGGTVVTINGMHLDKASAVTFAGVPAKTFQVDSANRIRAMSPPHSAGPVDVAVISPTGNASVSGGFIYIAQVRPDPSRDPDVIGLVNAQTSAATRFARQQIRTFRGRLERLHSDSDRRANDMNISVGLPWDAGPRLRGQHTNMQDQTALARLLEPVHTDEGQVSENYGYGRGAKSTISGLVRSASQAEGNVAEASDFSFWSDGFVNLANRNGDGIRLDSATIGVSGGFDYRFSPRFIGGVGIGYGRDRTDVGGNGSESRSNAVSMAFYGSFEPHKNLFVDALAGVSRLEFHNKRFVSATGERTMGERTGKQFFTALTAAYEFRSERWLVSPYGRFEFSRSWLNSSREKGGGMYDLLYGGQRIDTISGVLGFRANHSWRFDWGLVSPGIRAEYTHDFEGASRLRLGYADTGILPYVLESEETRQNYMTLGLMLDVEFENQWMLGLEYDLRIGAQSKRDERVAARLQAQF